MPLAESAVLANFHTIRMSLLILGRIVVALLAFCAGESNSCTHGLHLHQITFLIVEVKKNRPLIFSR